MANFRRSAVHGLLVVAAAVTTVLVAGCNIGPKYHRPVIQPPPAFKEAPANFKPVPGWTVAQPQDAKIRGDWWQIFNEPELNTLEVELNKNNENIKTAFQNYMAARAIVREARSQYFPTISVAPGFTRSRSSGNLKNAATATGSGGVVANAGQQSTIYSLPLDIAWAPDLFGRIRNEVRQAQYQAQASAADLESEKLAEQSSLATYFFEIRGQDALVKLFASTIDADRQALEFAQSRYKNGLDTYISVIEARNTLERAQSSATNLGILRAQYEHAIAVLVGKPPSEFSIKAQPLTASPPPVPIGVPSLLLERRPDVAAAERTVAAANAQIGIGYSAFFPSLTISARGGTQASSLAHLVDWPSRFWSLGASFSQPIFEGGLPGATLNQFVAIYNADVDHYRQTVLTAFQQVEDSLAAVRLLSRQISQQRSVVASSQQALNLEMGRYRTGIDPYLDVVTLQTTLLADQQTLAGLQVDAMTSTVSLVSALGGGWDRSQLPTPSQVGAKPPKSQTKMQQ